MLRQPGNLSDLGPIAQEVWDAEVVGLVTKYIQETKSQHFRVQADDTWPKGVSIVDWDGFPRILQNCLGDERASELCDWKLPTGDMGRALAQDEYCEWRTIRDRSGKLIRVEITTELAIYWEILAAYHPMKTLRLLGQFAGERIADWREVYGYLDPFGPKVTPKNRRDAFKRMMEWSDKRMPVKSPYNNGQKAIAFLSKSVSSLNAAVALFVSAAVPYGKRENGEEIALNGAEAIASTQQSAIDCRNSDPNMVGRMNEIVWDGRAVAFDDPAGVYIRSFAHEVLLDPDGNPIPEDWVEFQRGSRPEGGVGEERSQRLVIEVPPGLGFVLEDVVNADTNERIRYGYQLAELTKLACYLRTSDVQVVNSPRQMVPLKSLADCSSNANCASWNEHYNYFKRSQETPAHAVEAIKRNEESLFG